MVILAVGSMVNTALRASEVMSKKGVEATVVNARFIKPMDKEMLESMADCGLCAVKYGVESGTQELINNSGKNLSLARVEYIVKITKKLGLKLHLTFMLGIMGETDETIKNTDKFLFKLDPDSAQFSIATPFPGSRYYEMLVKKSFI